MNGHDIIVSYEKSLRIVGLMTTAAEQSDWDRYLEFQNQLNLELSSLQLSTLADKLDTNQQQTVSELIKSIQMQIANIRHQVEGSLIDLTAKIDNTYTQKKLELAYKSL